MNAKIRGKIHQAINKWNGENPAFTIKPYCKVDIIEEGLDTFTLDNIDECNIKWIEEVIVEKFTDCFNTQTGGGAGDNVSSYEQNIRLNEFKPQWDKWLKMPLLKLHYLCALSANIEPSKIEELDKYKQKNCKELIRKYEDKVEQAKSFIEAEILKVKKHDLIEFSVFVDWLDGIGTSYPSEMKDCYRVSESESVEEDKVITRSEWINAGKNLKPTGRRVLELIKDYYSKNDNSLPRSVHVLAKWAGEDRNGALKVSNIQRTFNGIISKLVGQ